MEKINLYKEYLLEHVENLLEYYDNNQTDDKFKLIVNDIKIEIQSTSDEDKIQKIAERLDYLISLKKVF